ncbi:MarR family transcriptional regulator [Streptomyces sp. NPDC005393]|uniref:MarR family winged helix-turn-helix transcriptional regulator n=1 Tax=Streptomyces sp. NPDC005393 TaxID=3157041 RepID=UPI00339EC22F
MPSGQDTGTDADTGADTALVEVLDSVVGLYRGWLDAWLRERGLSAARVGVLTRLRYDGPQPMKQLAARLAVTRRNITGLVDSLQADGLACRDANPDDGRSTLVSLTDAGAQLMDELKREHTTAAGALLGTLPDTTREQLRAPLAALRRVLLDIHEHRGPDRP